jgi:hypothetical protein
MISATMQPPSPIPPELRLGEGVIIGMLVTLPEPRLLGQDWTVLPIIIGAAEGAAPLSITTGTPFCILMTKRLAGPAVPKAAPAPEDGAELDGTTRAWSSAVTASEECSKTESQKRQRMVV